MSETGPRCVRSVECGRLLKEIERTTAEMQISLHVSLPSQVLYDVLELRLVRFGEWHVN